MSRFLNSRTPSSSGVGPSGNLTAWLRSVNPTCYLFVSARSTGETDSSKVVQLVESAGQVFDVVGLFMYSPLSEEQPTTYQTADVPDHLALDRQLFHAYQDLIGVSV